MSLLCRVKSQWQKADSNQGVNGAPERIRTSDPQIRRLNESVENTAYFCKLNQNRCQSNQSDSFELQTEKRVAKTLSGWLAFASTGDIARAILAPTTTVRAIYGSPVSAGKLLFLERLLNGGDVAVVQSFNRKLVVMPEESFLAIMEPRHGL